MFLGNTPADFGHLPPQFTGDVQTFFPNSITANTYWQHWTKPRGVSMVYMCAVGGGGGGGGGREGATNTARGGGGGGGSGAYATLMVPAIFLPDVLKIQVGHGGQGGAASTNGTAGIASGVSFGSGLTAGGSSPNLILRGNGGSAGGAGSLTAGGTFGAAGTVTGFGAIQQFGVSLNNSGQAGVGGGAHTGNAGSPITSVFASSPLSGGSGGAGINTPAQVGFAGGALGLQSALDFGDGTLTPAAAFRAGGVAGTLGVAGGPGNAGLYSIKPFHNTGGTGGGSCDNAAGGAGGPGGIGCGGGGGGAGTTGGRGGDGGPGIVIIISW